MSKANTDDQRAHKAGTPYGFVIMVDKFLSGWGKAEGGRSHFAIQVTNKKEADIVEANGKRRAEMLNVRFAANPPSIERNDHLSIRDRNTAGPWFEPQLNWK